MTLPLRFSEIENNGEVENDGERDKERETE